MSSQAERPRARRLPTSGLHLVTKHRMPAEPQLSFPELCRTDPEKALTDAVVAFQQFDTFTQDLDYFGQDNKEDLFFYCVVRAAAMCVLLGYSKLPTMASLLYEQCDKHRAKRRKAQTYCHQLEKQVEYHRNVFGGLLKTQEGPRSLGREAKDIEVKELDWLYEPWLLRNYLTVLEGHPKAGKGVLLMDWIARLTTGRELPRAQPLAPMNVVWFSADEGAGDIILPRFLAAGGDRERLRIVDLEERLVIPGDMPSIKHTIMEKQAAIAVIDPISSFFDRKVDTHNDAKYRSMLWEVAEAVKSAECTLIAIRHLQKSDKGGSQLRGNGGVGMLGQVRSGGRVGWFPDDDRLDPDARRVLISIGNNNAPDPESIAYKIKPADGGKYPRIEYDLDARNIGLWQLRDDPEPAKGRSKLEIAQTFLSTVLELAGDEGMDIETLKIKAMQQDISWATLRRAREDAGDRIIKGVGTQWGRWIRKVGTF